MQMGTTADSRAGSLNIMVYGLPGTGKTTSIGESFENPLIVDAEHGTASLRRYQFDRCTGLETPADVREVYSVVASKLNGGAGKYDVVVWDSLSEVARRMFQYYMKQPSAKSDSRRAYLETQRMIQGMHSAFSELPIHKVYVMHQTLDDGLFMPALPGKSLLSSLMHVMDAIVFYDYSVADPTQRVMRLTTAMRALPYGGKNFIARGRFPPGTVIPEELPQNLKYVISTITNDLSSFDLSVSIDAKLEEELLLTQQDYPLEEENDRI